MRCRCRRTSATGSGYVDGQSIYLTTASRGCWPGGPTPDAAVLLDWLPHAGLREARADGDGWVLRQDGQRAGSTITWRVDADGRISSVSRSGDGTDQSFRNVGEYRQAAPLPAPALIC